MDFYWSSISFSQIYQIRVWYRQGRVEQIIYAESAQ